MAVAARRTPARPRLLGFFFRLRDLGMLTTVRSHTDNAVTPRCGGAQVGKTAVAKPPPGMWCVCPGCRGGERPNGSGPGYLLRADRNRGRVSESGSRP